MNHENAMNMHVRHGFNQLFLLAVKPLEESPQAMIIKQQHALVISMAEVRNLM